MDPAVLREDMVDGLQHASKGVLSDQAVATAMRTVPRRPFCPPEVDPYADRHYRQHGTRVLSPRMAARILQAAAPQPGESVLIVGAGVGYTVALAAEIVGETAVHAVDISRRLVWTARENLESAGYDGVLVDRCDGANGLPAYAPFDLIVVEAAVVSPPERLRSQLAPGGRLVYPAGTTPQRLTVVSDDGQTTHGLVALAPLLVAGEEPDAIERDRTVREDDEYALQRGSRRRGWELEWIDWEGSDVR